MSKRSDGVAAEECVALGARQQQLEAYPNREVRLGALAISRALPIRERRLVDPWCSEIAVSSRSGGRVLLIGGPPFPETILMWWNFVARTPEEIAEARADWEGQRRFGDVRAYRGPRLAAPSLTRMARPNPVS